MAPHSSYGVVQVSGSPEMPNVFWKEVMYTLFEAWIFTVNAKLKGAPCLKWVQELDHVWKV